jgi:peptide-methionine (S)-S-oxide reductase
VVRITFDPEVITFRDLSIIFFHSHDPTTLNEQGPDRGTQYRSIVLYINEEQKKATEKVVEELQGEGVWGNPFVTELVPYEVFYVAEESHQDYYRRNPDKGYCKAIISPKLIKMRKLFADRLK